MRILLVWVLRALMIVLLSAAVHAQDGGLDATTTADASLRVPSRSLHCRPNGSKTLTLYPRRRGRHLHPPRSRLKRQPNNQPKHYPSSTAFEFGGHVDGFGANAVNQMRHAGMTWVKRQIHAFQDYAGAINEAHANGFRILLGVVGEPGAVSDDHYLDQYAQSLASAAALGADAIEVWNEPNIDREWATGQINPQRYTEMLRRAYNAIKAANPNTLVISAAPAPTGAEGAFGLDRVWNDNRFVQGMAAAGAANYLDCIGIHYNEGIIAPNQTSGDPRDGYYTRYFWGMVNTYYNAFNGARKLCFTEFGYLTPEGFPPLPGGFAWAQNVTLAQQASWLDQAVALAANSGKVRLMIVWNIDFGRYDSDPMAGYAIIRPGGGCPACDALAS
jgi:hypothetical protein